MWNCSLNAVHYCEKLLPVWLFVEILMIVHLYLNIWINPILIPIKNKVIRCKDKKILNVWLLILLVYRVSRKELLCFIKYLYIYMYINFRYFLLLSNWVFRVYSAAHIYSREILKMTLYPPPTIFNEPPAKPGITF